MLITTATKITICRMFFIPFFVASLLYYSPEQDGIRFIALGIFVLTIITDGIDGYIARAWNQKSKAGAILDPLADKMLLTSGFLVLFFVSPKMGPVQFPKWLLVTVISRDVMILLAVSLVLLLNIHIKLEASLLGKATTVFQMACIIAVLLQWPHAMPLWFITMLLCVFSMLDYVIQGVRSLNELEAGT